jgi:hypothetical protein
MYKNFRLLKSLLLSSMFFNKTLGGSSADLKIATFVEFLSLDGNTKVKTAAVLLNYIYKLTFLTDFFRIFRLLVKM